jgi:hypothetical protein
MSLGAPYAFNKTNLLLVQKKKMLHKIMMFMKNGMTFVNGKHNCNAPLLQKA